jgi:hypothetical protein
VKEAARTTTATPISTNQIQGGVPLPPGGGTGEVVLVGATDVDVEVEADDEEAGLAWKATTRWAAGARSRPAPIEGVGKWLAGEPTEACCRTAPVVGSNP